MVALPVMPRQLILDTAHGMLRRKFDIGADMRFEKTDVWTANKAKCFQAGEKSKCNNTLTASGELEQRPPLKRFTIGE